MELKKILEKITQNENCEEVLELILDCKYIKNCLSEEDKRILENYSATRVFGMNACNLVSLQNFPGFKELEILELSDNKFGGAELKNLPAYEDLREIRLANTKIDSFEDIKNLTRFKNLESLELEECPITKQDKYREKVFEILPDLLYLDNLTRDGQPYQNDSDEEDPENEEGDDDFISHELEELEDEEGEFDEDGEEEEIEAEEANTNKRAREQDNEESERPGKKRKLE